MPDNFLRPAVCAQCGSFVLDEKAHQAFHDAIKNMFIQHANTVNSAFEKAGFVRKQPERPLAPKRAVSTTSAVDVRGGRCRKCSGTLVLNPKYSDYITATIGKLRKISDSTVPYLVCISCGREIRRG